MANGPSSDDLQAAVDAGVIDAAQAEKLRAMRGTSTPLVGPDGEPAIAGEERFRFLNGFNDVFLTIGVLLITGAAFATGFLLLASAILWILSELLVRRLRAVLPGIVLSTLFVATTAISFQYYWYGVRTHWDISSAFTFWANLSLNLSLPALVASTIYYLRFRLPYALLLIVFSADMGLVNTLGQNSGISYSTIQLVFGLAVLIAALYFDMRDPKRVTRLSDCAFWLHIAAAFFITSPLLGLIKSSTGGMTASAIILLTVFLFAIFALAIDRRALLVSSLASFTYAVYNILSGGDLWSESVRIQSSFTLTLALVGGFVLILGVFWHPLRNRLLPVLQSTPLGPYLPQARP
jgi:hypothetical protein